MGTIWEQILSLQYKQYPANEGFGTHTENSKEK